MGLLKRLFPRTFESGAERDARVIRSMYGENAQIVGYLDIEDRKVYSKARAENVANKMLYTSPEAIEFAHNNCVKVENLIRDHFGIPHNEAIEVHVHDGAVIRKGITIKQDLARAYASIEQYEADEPQRRAEIQRLTGR